MNYTDLEMQSFGFYEQTASVEVQNVDYRMLKILSGIQIFVGVLCVAVNSAAIYIQAAVSYVGYGIWSGLFVS